MSTAGWPELDALRRALRDAGAQATATAIDDAEAGAATGTEAMERLAMALDAHDAARAQLGPAERRLWDAVMRRVLRGYPLKALAYWLRRRWRA